MVGTIRRVVGALAPQPARSGWRCALSQFFRGLLAVLLIGVIAGTVALLAGLVLTLLVACAYAPPAKSNLDAAKTAVQRTETRHDSGKIDRVINPDGTITETELVGPVYALSQSATSQGASAKSEGQKLSDNINTTAPRTAITPEGPTASGGDTVRTSTAEGDHARLRLWSLIGGGALVILIGLGAIYFGYRRAGIIAIGVGGGILACGLWPEYGLYASLGLNVVQAIIIVNFDKLAHILHEGMRNHEEVVSELPDEQRTAYRRRYESIDQTKGGTDKKVSLKIRAKDGLVAALMLSACLWSFRGCAAPVPIPEPVNRDGGVYDECGAVLAADARAGFTVLPYILCRGARRQEPWP